MKPHIGSEVNLLSSYLPVQWNDVKFIWNNSYLYCSCRWKWRVIIAVNFQFKQLEIRSLKKIRASTGFEPVTSAIPVRCSPFHCTGRYELNKLTSLPMCGFIAQLVEHRTGIAEVTGSNPVEALIFFRLLLSNCLNWKFTAMITLHFHLQPQYKYELFHINFTSFHCTGRYELNKLTSLPMCGFIAQLVEHRTGIAEVTGSNPVEALIIFRLLLSNCLNWKFTAMISLHFHELTM